MHRPVLFVALIALPAIASAQAVQPGKWEVVTTVNSMDMPGAPPGMAAMMKGHPIKISHCVTPDEAMRGPQDMLKTHKECQFTHYSMSGGKLSSEMVCKQGGMTTTATTSGTFTPTSFTTIGRSVMTGSQAMTVNATAIGRRIGECK